MLQRGSAKKVLPIMTDHGWFPRKRFQSLVTLNFDAMVDQRI